MSIIIVIFADRKVDIMTEKYFTDKQNARELRDSSIVRRFRTAPQNGAISMITKQIAKEWGLSDSRVRQILRRFNCIGRKIISNQA